jgi:RNA polymerase sigma-70 factor (ECF subfamily)
MRNLPVFLQAESMDNATGMSTSQARELSVLWTKAHPVVSAYFRASLRDFHQAEDLLQETAAVVAEKFTTYDPSRSFVSWVLGVARNKLLHYLRTHSNDRHVFDEDTIREITDMYAEVEPEGSVMAAALETCIDRVSGRPRKVLEMRYIRELTPAQIAGQTGMNANAVAVMLHRIRRALRECIEKQVAALRHAAAPPRGTA